MKVFYVFVLFLTLHSTSGGYVKDLTDRTFKDAIQKNKLIMVTFYSPRCGYSRRMLPEYEKTAATLLYNNPPIPVAKVNCIGKGKKTCWSIPVRGYPTITFYKNGEKQKNFRSARLEKYLVKYATSHADASMQTSINSKNTGAVCERRDDARCVPFYFGSKDYYCKKDEWIQRNCKRMCGLCHSLQAPKQIQRVSSWGTWSGFSSCSVTCGEGVEQRTRVCNGGGKCAGPSTETRQCNPKPCNDPCSPCTCDGVRMKCNGLALTRVPQNIPPNIEQLDLQSNRISTIRGDEFTHLSNLQSINLGRNNLGALPLNTFQSLSKLKRISLFANKITNLPKGLFAGLFSLESLLISNNQLQSIRSGVFDELVNLRFLSLHSNQIVNIESGAFDNLYFLRRLQLYGNELSTLPPSLFHRLQSLSYLELHRNKISYLQPGMFQGLVSLKRLTLSDNGITTLPPGLFQDQTALTHLFLKNNEITQLPSGIFSSFDRSVVRRLNLWNNPLVCSCDLYDILEFFKKMTWGKCNGNVRLSSMKRQQMCV